MKRLLLVRHAKSNWEAPAGGDHERPLAPRGRNAAKLMGRFLTRAAEVPDAIITSSALRARTTVEIMAQTGDWRCPIEITGEFYESRPEAVLAVARRWSDEHACLLLAGHEPVWSGLVGRLTGGSRVLMVTAAVAAIDFDVASWSEVSFGTGELIFLVTPKLLAGLPGKEK